MSLGPELKHLLQSSSELSSCASSPHRGQHSTRLPFEVGIERCVIPSGAAGGGYAEMPPAQWETERHLACCQEQHQSPALSSSPAPRLELLKQSLESSGIGTGQGTAHPCCCLGAKRTAVVSSLGMIFRWLRKTLTNSPHSLSLAGWVRKRQRKKCHQMQDLGSRRQPARGTCDMGNYCKCCPCPL